MWRHTQLKEEIIQRCSQDGGEISHRVRSRWSQNSVANSVCKTCDYWNSMRLLQQEERELCTHNVAQRVSCLFKHLYHGKIRQNCLSLRLLWGKQICHRCMKNVTANTASMWNFQRKYFTLGWKCFLWIM